MSKIDPVYPPPPPPPGAEPPPPTYQPPPPGYQQPPPPGYGQPGTSTNVVIVTQPGLMGGPQAGAVCMYREVPVLIVCQHCQATVTTSTCFSVGTFTWIVAAVILFLGFWLGCCLIPFCVDGCKDVIHTCPNCRQTVGRYNRM